MLDDKSWIWVDACCGKANGKVESDEWERKKIEGGLPILIPSAFVKARSAMKGSSNPKPRRTFDARSIWTKGWPCRKLLSK